MEIKSTQNKNKQMQNTNANGKIKFTEPSSTLNFGIYAGSVVAAGTYQDVLMDDLTDGYTGLNALEQSDINSLNGTYGAYNWQLVFDGANFDLVFTFSEDLLETLPNARFYPGCASSWYGTKFGGGKLSNTSYLSKQKNVSIVASSKARVPLHKFRLELAKKLKREGLADTYGTFDSGQPVMIADALRSYRFSFAIENDLKPLFFTERLTSCFAAMTIPIYLGASKISQFFNPDGIIQLKASDLDDIEKIIQLCTRAEYERRLPAIMDNYNRVKPFLNANDWLYENYFKQDGD